MPENEPTGYKNYRVLDMYSTSSSELAGKSDHNNVYVHLTEGSTFPDLCTTLLYLNPNAEDYVRELCGALNDILPYARPNSPEETEINIIRLDEKTGLHSTASVMLPGYDGTDDPLYYYKLLQQLPSGGMDPEWNHRLAVQLIDNGNIPALVLFLSNRCEMRRFANYPPRTEMI